MDYYTEMKIGQLANTVLRACLLDEKCVSADEIEQLLSLEMSKLLFGLNFPVLVLEEKKDKAIGRRYYAQPLEIRKKTYYLSNHWFEPQRGKLVKWLDAHEVGRN